MPNAPRLSHAGALSALLSVVAVACGPDIVNLLPPRGDAGSSPGGGGGAGSAGRDGGDGGAAGGGGTRAGTTAGGDSAGATSEGGNAGSAHAGSGSGGCLGAGCAGSGNGFGGWSGSPNCGSLPGSCNICSGDAQCPSDLHCSPMWNVCVGGCTAKGQCRTGESCDISVGWCVPTCSNSLECPNNRVCDPMQNICVQCIDNSQCEQDGDPVTRLCHTTRCVQCENDTDCTLGMAHVCSLGNCVECEGDKDCPGGGHCDIRHGHCE